MPANFATHAPPTEITVGGFAYPVDIDFRTWIEVTRMMRDFDPEGDTMEDMIANARILRDIQIRVFGGVLADEDAGEILSAITEFAAGYPEAPTADGGDDGAPCFSFEYDLSYIIVAIRNQSGIDLSYRRKEPFHWWEFLLEFRSLCGDHYILRLMEIRGYSGQDAKLREQAARYALPRETTRADRKLLDAFDEMFWGA